MHALPDDPFALVPPGSFAPAARRALPLCGGTAELCWLPERRARTGRPEPERTPFAPSVAERIVAEEAVWRGDGLVLTPNRHPFAARHLLLWSAAPRREPDRGFLETGFELARRARGALLANSIGAAASIAWCHAHIVGERMPFLDSLALEPCTLDEVRGRDVECFRASAPFPSLLVALRGDPAARAAAAERLLVTRTSAAYGLVEQAGTTWIHPRRAEFPGPDFPQALGAAELWGRWCYDQEDAFAAATPVMLERALGTAGYGRAAGSSGE